MLFSNNFVLNEFITLTVQSVKWVPTLTLEKVPAVFMPHIVYLHFSYQKRYKSKRTVREFSGNMKK